MTKAEQTLKNYVNKVDDTDDYILSAMEEQSIKFQKWTVKNHWKWSYTRGLWYNMITKKTLTSTSELYKLFNEL